MRFKKVFWSGDDALKVKPGCRHLTWGTKRCQTVKESRKYFPDASCVFKMANFAVQIAQDVFLCVTTFLVKI